MHTSYNKCLKIHPVLDANYYGIDSSYTLTCVFLEKGFSNSLTAHIIVASDSIIIVIISK